MACAISGVLNAIGLQFFKSDVQPVPQSYYFFYTFILITGIFTSRFSYRFFRGQKHRVENRNNSQAVMIIGAGEAANIIIKDILTSNYSTMSIKCIIDDDVNKWGKYIQGIRVVGGRDRIVECADLYDIDEIIVAIPSVSRAEMKKILDICKNTNCKLRSLPGMYQLVNGEVNVSQLRKVDIADLLGRDQVQIDLDSVMSYVKDRVILVTGGGGSIGSELCRQIATHKPKQLIIFDIYENSAYAIQQELSRNYPELDLKVLIGSVRNTNRVNSVFEKYHPDIVYHAAAHKHVPLMEDSPNEAIKNNVMGTWKLAEAASTYGTKRFVMISTDKAVNPTNIMGASKRICEMIIQSYNNRSETEFVAVRFGNVLGSNGSVIPLFKKQIEAGGPVTVTHPKIIRYFMTIPEAVSLVLQAGAYAKGGEIFVLEMGEPVRILDLAINLIRLSGYVPGEDIQIQFTGLRPGEKLYE
jgi:FlaA1/EpsC-like NDP-sugar epimerase